MGRSHWSHSTPPHHENRLFWSYCWSFVLHTNKVGYSKCIITICHWTNTDIGGFDNSSLVWVYEVTVSSKSEQDLHIFSRTNGDEPLLHLSFWAGFHLKHLNMCSEEHKREKKIPKFNVARYYGGYNFTSFFLPVYWLRIWWNQVKLVLLSVSLQIVLSIRTQPP